LTFYAAIVFLIHKKVPNLDAIRVPKDGFDIVFRE
jgi:hypothetical protein